MSASSGWYEIGPFVGAAGVLHLLPFVPALVSPLPVSPLFPLCVDALVLCSVAMLTYDTRFEHLGIGIASVGLGGVLLYQIYDALVYSAFGRSGLLYDDLQYVVDLLYFARDSASLVTVVGMVGGTLALVAVGWSLPRLMRVVARGRVHATCRWSIGAVHLVAWPLVLVIAPWQQWGPENLTYQTSNERVRVRTVAGKASENVQASMRMRGMLDSLRTVPVDSTYARYDSLRWSRRPNLFLLMIESYGEVLHRHPDLRAPYHDMMRRLESDLSADGWHSASAWSDAAVRGGRSWLAIASVFLGTRVGHQLLYEQFQAHPERPPHLIRFLNRQGYRTLTLQPYMKARPGLPVGNPYGFDVTLYRNDLPYEGPPYGWGFVDVPDQWSLGYAHDKHIAPATQPVFLFFETVLSHALWNYGVPPVLPDWTAFAASSTAASIRQLAQETGNDASALLPDSLTAPRIVDQPTPQRFLRHIAYEWMVMRWYLQTKIPPNSLVIVMGDHQPPLLPTETFGVPVHVLSRDAALVEPFRMDGYVPGLHPEGAPRRTHAGLYAEWVRAITRANGSPRDALPPRKPAGVAPSILTPAMGP